VSRVDQIEGHDKLAWVKGQVGSTQIKVKRGWPWLKVETG